MSLAGRLDVNSIFHILICRVGGRERDSAPSSTGTLTDLRYERLETTLSLSLSLSLSLCCKQQKIQYWKLCPGWIHSHSLLSAKLRTRQTTWELYHSWRTRSSVQEIFAMTIVVVETRRCNVFVRGGSSLDKSFAILKTSNIPYLIICLIFVYNI